MKKAEVKEPRLSQSPKEEPQQYAKYHWYLFISNKGAKNIFIAF
jgi:hypothetical protein